MPRVKLSTELKKAISELSHKEKDKLLNRLIAKDDLLVEQLEFRLLENSSTTQDRREAVKYTITDLFDQFKDGVSTKQMLWMIRKLSSIISRHVRVTGDKYGDIELNLILVQTTFEEYAVTHLPKWNKPSFKLREYLVKKMLSVGKRANKIHSDYLLDFSERLESIGEYFNQDERITDICEDLNVDVGGLLEGRFT